MFINEFKTEFECEDDN